MNAYSFWPEMAERKTGNPRLYCPECHNNTHHTVVANEPWTDDFYGPEGEPASFDMNFIFAKCDGCGMPALYRAMEDDAPDDAPSILFPEVSSFDGSVPETVRRIWAEAQPIQERAPGAFAVQIGIALEHICKDRKAEGRTLREQLKNLVDRGELPGSIATMADSLRSLRNFGAHASDVRINVPDAWALGEFFEAIVQYIYVWPAKVGKLQVRLESMDAARGKSAPAKPP